MAKKNGCLPLFFLCRLSPESVPIPALKNKLRAAGNKELLWTSR
ncbi:hypothetical protein T07_10242 [Trichinella nelsoni]|uniref:Uncharacterized protein n=1 Tax=Trichinella nelsoni TaxID=6336 RepID=A0A0V0RBI0_9BILA|nr:hypothetical protein T07_10242 [Trichinella nelsoni]